MTLSAFLGFLGRRLLKAFAVVLGVIIVAFFIVRLAPGDPASVIAGQSGAADAQFMAQLRQHSLKATSRCLKARVFSSLTIERQIARSSRTISKAADRPRREPLVPRTLGP